MHSPQYKKKKIKYDAIQPRLAIDILTFSTMKMT